MLMLLMLLMVLMMLMLVLLLLTKPLSLYVCRVVHVYVRASVDVRGTAGYVDVHIAHSAHIDTGDVDADEGNEVAFGVDVGERLEQRQHQQLLALRYFSLSAFCSSNDYHAIPL